MERIEFKEIHIENFMSFKDTSLELASSGMHFVYGEVEGQSADSNGAGKSAWVEALAWCLFGKTLRNVKADEVINNSVGKNCRVMVIFEKGDEAYYATRYRKTEEGSGVEFGFWGAGKNPETDLTGANNDETNAKIEAVLGFSFELFTNTICHGQGLPYRFTQATDAEKKEIFDEILNLGWMQDAKRRASELEKRYREVVATMESDKIMYEERVKALDDTIAEHEKHREEIEDEEPPTEDTTKIREADAKKRELREKIEQRKVRLAKLERLIGQTKEKATPVREALEKFGARKVALEERIDVAEEILKKAKGGVSDIKALVGKPCPVCARSIRKEDMEGVREHLAKDVAEAGKNVKELKEKLEYVAEQYLKMCNDRAALDEKMDILTGEKSSLELENEQKEREIASYDSETSFLKGRLATWNSARTEKLEDVARQIEQTKKRKKEAMGALKESTSMMKYTNKLANVMAFWVDGFGSKGIRSLVLDSVLPFLNERANQYSEVLTNGDFKIDFRAQSETQRGEVRERFVVDVSRNADAVGYTAFSGGEKRRVDIVVLLALHDLIAFQSGIDTNVQIFDEVAENLDETGTARLLEVLAQRSENRGIYLISHRNDISADFASTVKVTKDEEGFSSIKVR